MNTASLKLSVREALESSLSFSGQFFKQHWLLAVIYILLGALPAFIIGDQDVSDISLEKKIGLSLCAVFNLIPCFLLVYYSLRDSLLKLDPSNPKPNKSLAFALWQMFCMSLLSGIIVVPLLILLILPGIWWSTKCAVSFPNLLSTNDGVIESLRKSHQLMNERFWQCFGFLVATSSTVILVSVIVGITIGFFLLIGGLLNAVFHEGAGLNRAMMIFRILGPIFAVFTNVVFYYIQAWLYVYLKQDNAVPVTAV